MYGLYNGNVEVVNNLHFVGIEMTTLERCPTANVNKDKVSDFCSCFDHVSSMSVCSIQSIKIFYSLI